MGIVRARIPTVEEIYGLVWTAVANQNRSRPTTRAGIDYFVGTDWAGIGKATARTLLSNTAAKVGADSTPWFACKRGFVLR